MTGIDARVTLVTGGSRGIGRAVVERLLRDGGAVVATGRDGASLAALRAAHPGEPLETVVGDAVDRAHQAATVAHALDRFGQLDALVANAGAHDSEGPVLAEDDEGFRRTWEVNVLAVRSWVRAAARHWTTPGSGSVVTISSIAGVRAERMLGVYGTTKAAQGHLVQQLALELGPNVRVNAVAPGFTATDGTRRLGTEGRARLAAVHPLQRIAQPDDIAAPVAFLLTPGAAMITGQTLVVDGGFTLTVAGGYADAEDHGGTPAFA